MPSDAPRILFVCLGNICRSPTAEAVFRARALEAGLDRIVIDSAGMGDWHVGNPPDPRAIRHAARRGYDLTTLRARQFVREDFARFDRIYAMDTPVLDDIASMRPRHYAGRLALFLDVAPHLRTREVPDPYQGGPDGFEHVLDLVEAASDALVRDLAAR